MRTHWDKLQIQRAPLNPHLHWRRQNLSCFCSILNLWGITWIFVVVKKRRLVIWVKTVKVVGLGKVNIFCSILMHAWDWIPTLFLQRLEFLTITIYGKTLRNITLTSCFLHNYHSSCTHFLSFLYSCLTENFTVVLSVAQLINRLHFTKSNVHISFCSVL